MNQSLQGGVQQRRDGLLRKPQTELQGGQGGPIFSAPTQEAVVVQTHAQNSILWTDTEQCPPL